MNLINQRIDEFLNLVDSPTPTPGGGSVSALAIAQGISLINMTAHLSIKKKMFLNSEKEVQKQYLANFTRLKEIKNNILTAVDADTKAFNEVMNAYKHPKDTDEQIKKRDAMIKAATIKATQVPYEFVVIALNSLKIASEMFPLTSPSTISDFGVGVLMINSGLKGGILNIKTNMTGLSKDDVDYVSKASKIEEEAEILFHSIYNKILKKLG